MGGEGVSYHIRLILNLESDQWKSLHLSIVLGVDYVGILACILCIY